MFNTQIQTYKFNIQGLEKAKKDILKKKIDNVSNIIIYGVIIILFANGVIGSKFLINMVVCTGTSKTVKWFMK